MKDKNLKGYLQQSLGEEVQPKRLEETIKLCTEIVREQEVTRAEPRTGFFHYLSDVFRFEGIPIFGLQAVTLFIVCLTIGLFTTGFWILSKLYCGGVLNVYCSTERNTEECCKKTCD